jgi:hypothetical protein
VADNLSNLGFVRSPWLSPRALGLHATLIIVLPCFILLGLWQLHRALSGNTLSWAYTFEWPLFAGYAIYMWWKLVHEDRALVRPPRARRRRRRDEDPEAVARADAELAAYNAYLAELHAEDERRRAK